MKTAYATLVAPVVGFFRRVFRWDEPKVPDLLEMKLEDVSNAVELEKKKQELIRQKSVTAKMEDDATR